MTMRYLLIALACMACGKSIEPSAVVESPEVSQPVVDAPAAVSPADAVSAADVASPVTP